MRKLLALALVLGIAGIANAEFIPFDYTSNDTFPTAEPMVSDIPIVNARLAACTPSSDIGLGALAAGDVDYYSIALPAGCVVSAMTTSMADPFFLTPDTTLGAFSPAGALLVANDDAGFNPVPGAPVYNSAVRFVTTVAGVYSIAVSGFPDLAFVPGSHGVEGGYALTVSVFPEPGTLALLAAGLALMARRRR